MGQKRDEVEEAARNCQVINAYLQGHRHGMADYETALEAMALHLASERAYYQGELLRRMQNEPSPMIFINAEGVEGVRRG